MSSKNNVYLIGFRGTGKSSLAPRLATRLRWESVDTDVLIMERTGSTIRDFLHRHGEAAFRELESQVFQEIASGEHLVVATGGGLVLREDNRQFLKERGVVVWLQSSVEIIWERLEHDPQTVHSRPALTPLPVREEILHLLEQRTPLYHSLADFSVDTGALSFQDSVEAILQQLAAFTHGLD